jgi:hypothetical protein
MKRPVLLLALFMLLFPALSAVAAEMDDADPPAAASAPAPSGERRKPVRISEESPLPLRVLTRAMSSLYKGPNEDSGIVQSNLPTFAPYFVYTRPGGEDRALEQGWYEVGTDNRGTIVGWLKTADVFEWKQTMVVSYTHPENRQPVLLFDSREKVSELLGKSQTERGAEAEGLYKTIDSGTIPPGFPVVSIEPKMAVDFLKEFYLLPILDFESVSIEGREGRLLEIAAVGGGAGAREKTDIRENKEYAAQAGTSASQAAESGDVAKNLKFDVVWVIDTTRSMQPFIAGTREVVAGASKLLASKAAVSDQLKFGLWAYRDPVEDIPAIEYLTRNYTPELEPVDVFLQGLDSVQETKTDSVDYPEDVFSGVADAIGKTSWTPGAVRVMILVGDAPAHEKGHKWNKSEQDEETLRALLTENKVTMITIQLRPNGAKNHQKVQERQFKRLAQNPGAEKLPYYSVPVAELPLFAQSTEKVVGTLAALLDEAQSGNLGRQLEQGRDIPVVPLSGELAALAEDDDAPRPAEAAAKAPAGGEAAAPAAGKPEIADADAGLSQSLKAAVVQWLGSETNARPPRDVVAWVADKDLLDSSRASLEVRLLVSKRQLDGLATLLADMIKAGRTGQISGDDFFTALQSASATAARDPDRIKNAKSLAQSGLVPDFLNGLPYNSRIMVLSNEMWNSWSPDEQDNFLNELDARIAAYKQLHDNPEGWIALNQGADADDSVYPVLLELLP